MWAYPGGQLLFMGGEIAQWREWNEEDGVDWHVLDGERHRGVQELVRALNRVSVAWPALWERDHEPAGFQWLEADDADHSIYALPAVVGRRPPGRGLRRQLHAGATRGLPRRAAVGRRVARAARHQRHLVRRHRVRRRAGVWAADGEPQQGQPASAFVTLPPLGVLWLGADQSS